MHEGLCGASTFHGLSDPIFISTVDYLHWKNCNFITHNPLPSGHSLFAMTLRMMGKRAEMAPMRIAVRLALLLQIAVGFGALLRYLKMELDASRNFQTVEEKQAEIQSLRQKLETTRTQLATLKSQQAAATEKQQRQENSAPKKIIDGNEPDEFHRFEHIVTTTKALNQRQTKNLVHMDPVMRRSRPVIGNTERIHGFIQKLLDRKCTNVLFVGGSVTFVGVLIMVIINLLWTG